MRSNASFVKESKLATADRRHLTQHKSDGGITFGCSEMKGQRETMEDATLAQLELPPPPPSGDSPRHNTQNAIFGIFDGHLGTGAVSYVSSHLPGRLAESLDEADGELGRNSSIK